MVYGDSTHAAAMTKILAREMGIHVVWAGATANMTKNGSAKKSVNIAMK